MRAIGYTEENGVFTYQYDKLEMEKFIRHGQEFGNNGWFIVSYDSNTKRKLFNGFGTIENPIREMISINLTHFEPFDGTFNPRFPDEPPREVIPKGTYKFILLDMNSYNKEMYEIHGQRNKRTST